MLLTIFTSSPRLILFLNEFRSIIFKTLPLFVQKGGIAVRGIFLTWLLAQLGTHALAAGALVLSLFSIIANLSIGFFSSITIAAAQAHGTRRSDIAIRYLQHGFILSTVLAIVVSLFLLSYPSILIVLGQSPLVVAQVGLYTQGLAAAVFPFIWCTVIHQFFISKGRTELSMMYSLISISLLIIMSYLFAFGRFNFPILKIQGLGWSMALSYMISFLMMLTHLKKMSIFRNQKLLPKISNWEKEYFVELYHIGWPISMKFCVQASIFMIIAVWIGRFSVEALAAQQLLYQFFLLTNILLDSIGITTLVKVSFYQGQRKLKNIPYVLYSSIGFGFIVITLILLPLLCYPHIFFSWIPKSQFPHLMISTILIALPLVVIFQYLDSFRGALTNTLFGLKDVKFPLYAEIIGFWLVGLPLAIVAVNYFGQILEGVWFSLLGGLLVYIFLLTVRYKRIVKRLVTYPIYS